MNKNVLAIFSIIPLIAFIVIGAVYFSGAAYESTYKMSGSVAVTCCIMFLLLFVFTWVDAIWFIIIACKKAEWSLEKKIVWAVVLYTLSMFVFPIFWWLHIRSE